ncbi:MAG TPA: hypothetical protein VGH73_17335 [Thermoanaerobaculia bacterium]
MRRHTTLFATAILALSLAPALQAQGYDDHHDRDRYQGNDQGNDQGYGQGYDQNRPDNDRYAVPDPGRMDRAAWLAQEINDTATSIRRQAARNNRRPDRAEAQMLSDLFQLNRQAAHFQREAQGYRRDPRHTADDFARLEAAFNQVGQSLQYVQPRPYIDRGMDRIYDRMTELSRLYGRRGYDHWGHHGNGDGRDRYDNGHDRYDNGHGDHRGEHDNGYRPPYNP